MSVHPTASFWVYGNLLRCSSAGPAASGSHRGVARCNCAYFSSITATPWISSTTPGRAKIGRGNQLEPLCGINGSLLGPLRTDRDLTRVISQNPYSGPISYAVPAEAHCRRFAEAVFGRLQQRRYQAIALMPQRVFGERPASL
jgi:hypothetical protein